jgi:integrase
LTAQRSKYFWTTRDASPPDAFLGLPKEWNTDQIIAFQKHFDSQFAGNLTMRRRLKFMPGDFKYEQTKPPQLKDEYAPYPPLSRVAVSMRAKFYLRKAGIKVSRPGSHTLRHTCVQRLVDSGLSLKTIGDFIGHRTPDATKIYAKVNVEALRQVALGNGEEVL